MAVYQYTLFKYLKSPSTWIILILSMFIAGFLGGWLPFHVVAAHNKDSIRVYSMTVVAIVGTGASFLAIFVSVFAGFKVASMYKDEVEDGTFLIMLSKPKSRGRIIFEKWLALQTTMIVYSLLTIISFMISIAINDPGSSIVPAGSIISTLTSKIWAVGAVMLCVLIVIGFIFTSVALLLSTVVSAGSTIGITIAIGVVIPITSMISTFTTSPKYPSIKTSKLENTKALFATGANNLVSSLDSILKTLPAGGFKGIDKQGINNFLDSLNTFTKTEIYDPISKVANGPDGLSDLAINSGNEDEFKKVFFLDLNYQIHSMGSLASDIVIPPEFASVTADTKWGKLTGIPMTTKVTNAHPFKVGTEFDSMVNLITKNIEPVISAGFKGQKKLDETNLFVFDDDYPWQKPVLLPMYEKYFKSIGRLDEINSIVNTFHEMIVSPLYYILQPSVIDDIYDKQRFKFNVKPPVAANTIIDDKLTDYFSRGYEKYSYTKLGYTRRSFVFSANELGIVDKLITISLHDDENNVSSFVRVKKVPYANKYTILYIYLAIAILLTPLSFFVVRKQDFK